MFNSIGPTELIIVLVIVLLIFGPKRLPGLGRQLGGGMREFKDSIQGKGRDDDEPAETAGAATGERLATEKALGRPDGETAPLASSQAEPADGEIVPERRP